MCADEIERRESKGFLGFGLPFGVSQM